MRRLLRQTTIILLLSMLLVGIAFAAAEWYVRSIGGGGGFDPNTTLFWVANSEPGDVEQLEGPFYTNAEGLLVADQHTPGTNAQGFRSPPFDEPTLGRKTVVFLGDSFTWGEAAEPYTDAFVDRVRSSGYRTVNLGVPAIGPTQYAAAAKRYLPELKPDAVFVMVYMGNDLVPEPPIVPGLNRYYFTDAGMLFAATPEAAPLTFEQAVARQRAGAPWWMTPSVARLVSNSAVIRLAAQFGQVLRQPMPDMEKPLGLLKEAREAATVAGARFFLVLLPVRPVLQNQFNHVQLGIDAWAELSPSVPQGLGEEHYARRGDDHLNNAGHGVVAEHVLRILEAEGLNPVHVPDAYTDYLDHLAGVDALCGRCVLSDEECAALGEELETVKLKMAALLSLPSSSGAGSPVDHLTQLHKQGMDDEARRAGFEKFVIEHTPNAEYQSYYSVMSRAVYLGLKSLGGRLNPQALACVRYLPIYSYLWIPTAFEPIEEKVQFALDPSRKLPFETYARYLRLTPEQAAAIRAEVDGMKEDVAEILGRPPHGGGESPLAMTAKAATLKPKEAAAANARATQFAETQKEATDGRVYMELLAERTSARQAKIFELLSKEQREYFSALPTTDPHRIDTGKDPVGDAVGRLVGGEG